MQHRIEQFLQSLEARNASVNTVRAYRADLKFFRQFVGDINPASLTRHNVRDYLVKLNSQKLTRPSVTRKLACVKSFLKWLTAEGYVGQDVGASVMAPKIPQKLPRFYSEEEINKLLESDMLGPAPERDRAILELLYGSGIRVDELAGINLEDFCGSDAILVRGKGKKERYVLYGEYAQDALKAYMPLRAALLAKQERESPALFIGLRRTQHDRLDVRDILRVVQRAARAAGVPIRSPHAFRHSCATHMLEHGASIVMVSKLLGHSNLSTTERYTHISPGRMLQAYNAAHPHANG